MDGGEWLAGGCHCGAVRFRVRVRARRALRCNCSICSKKGFIGLIVAAEDFDVVSEDSELEIYRFNTGLAQHHFCGGCGIHPFSRPRSHPEGFDVNICCLDEWSGAASGDWEIQDFDGQNWEESVDQIR